MTEKLMEAHKFTDGMTEKEVPMAKVALPKWLIQGLAYGIVLGGTLFTVGTMAVGAFPGLFPAAFGIQMGAIGFSGAVGIAYTKDITE